MIMRPCKGKEIPIRLCPGGVTYMLWLCLCLLLIVFSNLLHKLARKVVSLNSPLSKEATQCTEHNLYLTLTQFEHQKEVCLILHYLHFNFHCFLCFLLSDRTEGRPNRENIDFWCRSRKHYLTNRWILWWFPAQLYIYKNSSGLQMVFFTLVCNELSQDHI